MHNISYDMTFEEVLHEIFNTTAWYQGEDFRDGVYISVEYDGRIMFRDFRFYAPYDYPNSWPLEITYDILHMKYRKIHTQQEAERKC